MSLITTAAADITMPYTDWGIAATYAPSTGGSLACTLLIDQSRSSMDVYLMADQRTEIVRVRKSEVPAVHPQLDRITKTADGSVWRVQGIVVESALEFVLAIVKDV